MAATLSKTNIKEANEHLKQLHQRIYDLETQLQLHALHVEDLQKSNSELKRQLTQAKAEKEEMKKKIKSKDELLENLLASAEEKDKAMIRMEEKGRLFHELVEHKGSLERILQVLDEVSKSHDQSCDQTSNGSKEHVVSNSKDHVLFSTKEKE